MSTTLRVIPLKEVLAVRWTCPKCGSAADMNAGTSDGKDVRFPRFGPSATVVCPICAASVIDDPRSVTDAIVTVEKVKDLLL